MQQVAKVTYDAQTGSLTLEGELQPANPTEHDMLVALVAGGMSDLDGDGNFRVDRDVVSYSFTFKKRTAPDQPAEPAHGKPEQIDPPKPADPAPPADALDAINAQLAALQNEAPKA